MTSVVGALIMAAVEVTGTAARTRPPRYLAFGPRGSQWVLLEITSRRIERVTLPTPDIDGLAVSRDGTQFVYVARAPSNKPGVWFWKRGAPAPLLIESGAGQYSDPAIGPDGSIYFSRSPVNGRSHAFGTYAQVFRARSDGTDLEQVTDERGCHFGVSFTGRGRLQYIHTSCSGHSWVERTGRTIRPEILIAVAGRLAEATTSPEGHSVLFVSEDPDSFVVKEVTGGSPPRVVLAIDRGMRRVRIAYGRDRNEILYQQGGKVWMLDHGVRRLIAPLESEALQ